MTYVETWDETKPAGSRDANLGDDDIREFKRAIRERLAAGGMHFPSTDDADAGLFNYAKFIEQSGNPTSEANRGYLFTKDVGGVTELYWMDSGGNVKQLTTAGRLLTATLLGDTAGKYLRAAGSGSDPAWGSNFPLEGYSTGINILRKIRLEIVAGGTPGTNINITEIESGNQFNNPTITDATNLAKGGSSGSFALNAGGTTLTMDITPDIIACIAVSTVQHKVKGASTTAGDLFWAAGVPASNNLAINFFQTGSVSSQDILTILTTSGDTLSLDLIIITST